MDKKINLEEILITVFDPVSWYCSTRRQDLQLAITLNPSLDEIKQAMKEACRQTLELAAENAEVEIEERMGQKTGLVWVDKQSILNTINQIE